VELRAARGADLERGELKYSLDYTPISYYLNRIGAHARRYPSSFENEEERAEIERRARELIEFLDILREENLGDELPHLLTLAGALPMAHNLGIEGTGTRARAELDLLLAKYPHVPEVLRRVELLQSGMRPLEASSSLLTRGRHQNRRRISKP